MQRFSLGLLLHLRIRVCLMLGLPVNVRLGSLTGAFKSLPFTSPSMPYISVEEHLPGITGLLEYRKDSAEPIRNLTQLLLRGPSTLTEGERELIATIVSYNNECRFCTAAHAAATEILLGECETAEKVKQDIETAPVSEKMKALLAIAKQVQKSGRSVTTQSIDRAKKAGATDI